MLIRATAKLLKLSHLKPVKYEGETVQALPGEWYAGLLSTSRPGKGVVHFLHTTTKISIIIPGKSLNTTVPKLPGRVSSFLERHYFSMLTPLFQLQAPPQIFTTNSRSMLAFMNQMKPNIEYHMSQAEDVAAID